MSLFNCSVMPTGKQNLLLWASNFTEYFFPDTSAGTDTKSEAIGVLEVIVQSAHLYERSTIFSPNPFVTLNLENSEDTTHTFYHTHTYDPNWMAQNHLLLVRSLQASLNLAVYNHHSYRKHSLIGSALFELSNLEEETSQTTVCLPLGKKGKENGEVLFSVAYYPANDEKDLETGIVRLVIDQAEGLGSIETSPERLSPLARVSLAHEESPIHTTRRCRHTDSPQWGSTVEFICFKKTSCILSVCVLDPQLEDPTLGYLSIYLEDLLDNAQEWLPLCGSKSAKLMMSAEWKPLKLSPASRG